MCFASETKAAHSKSGSVVVSLSVVAVSHSTPAQAGKSPDREVSMVKRPNRMLSTE